MTPFPAPNRLHVLWARRPLVASRAAVLASILPADADRDRFLYAIGIHGDPVATRQSIARAKSRKENLGPNPYGYPRAFSHVPDRRDKDWVTGSLSDLGSSELVLLDPTAGGGSIPLETRRLGLSGVAAGRRGVWRPGRRTTAQVRWWVFGEA